MYSGQEVINKHNYKSGFTLVELSIVIVIIGLIVAGVVGGQSLVRQSKLKSFINDINQYQVAINTFNLEYNALPGDIANAHSYWGNSCDTVAGRCNGDGNRIVGAGNNTNDDERYRATQHLSLSDLLPGDYTGVSTGFTDGLGENDIFFSKSGKGKFLLWNALNSYIFQPGGNISIRGNFGVLIGGPNVGQNVRVAGISVPDALNVDKKIDDGVANFGKFIAMDGSGLAANSCSAPPSTAGGADYNTANLNSDTLNCQLYYYLGY